MPIPPKPPLKPEHFMKNLYRGRFNWYGEIHIFHSRANSKRQVKQIMLNRLANKLNISRSKISGYYYKQENSYDIMEIRREQR
jgi:hypothetical protein